MRWFIFNRLVRHQHQTDLLRFVRPWFARLQFARSRVARPMIRNRLLGVIIFALWYTRTMIRNCLLGVIIFELRCKRAEIRNRLLGLILFDPWYTRAMARNRLLGVIIFNLWYTSWGKTRKAMPDESVAGRIATGESRPGESQPKLPNVSRNAVPSWNPNRATKMLSQNART